MKHLLLLIFLLLIFSGNAQPPEHAISGVVINTDNKEVLMQATVRILSTQIGTTTDDLGHYKLLIPDSLIGKRIILEYLCVGFLTTKKSYGYGISLRR